MPAPVLEDTLIDFLPAAVYVCEAPSGVITRFNRFAVELWGREPRIGDLGERFCGSRRLFLPDGTPLARSATPMAEALRTGASFRNVEVLVERPDGSRITVLVSIDPIRDARGAVVGAINVLQDITERRRADREQARIMAELEAERVRLRTITDNATVGLLMLDARRHCTFMNPAAEALTGFALAEVQGRPLHDIIHHTRPDGRRYPIAECPIDGALPRSDQERGEEALVRKDGSFYPVAYTASPIVADGIPVGTVVEIRDVSAAKRAAAEREALLLSEQRARAEAEAAVRARDAFLARASHELRTPLTSALGSVRLLRRAGREGDAEHVAELLAMASRNLGVMLALVNDLLDASKLASGQATLAIEPVALDSIVLASKELVETQAREKGVFLSSSVPEGLVLRADPLKLIQVLTNLLSNAVKFTPSGGSIQVDAAEEAGEVSIRVRDTGDGIPPGDCERIFEPFYQARSAGVPRPRGTGLGLAICRQIVGMHGGTISAASEGRGRGATFLVRLPLSPPREPTTELPAASALP